VTNVRLEDYTVTRKNKQTNNK